VSPHYLAKTVAVFDKLKLKDVNVCLLIWSWHKNVSL